jgi:naringenin degradation protein FdeH
MADGVRRVVTTHDAEGRSKVLFDEILDPFEREPLKTSGVRQFALWLTDCSPADISGNADAAERVVGIPPPPGGTIMRIVEFPPVTSDVDKLPLDHMEKILGEANRKTHQPSRHPFMHCTNTIDYIFVLDGEIDMLLDEGEVHFERGDVLVQRGTNHAWVNRGTEVCRLGIIVMDAKLPF